MGWVARAFAERVAAWIGEAGHGSASLRVYTGKRTPAEEYWKVALKARRRRFIRETGRNMDDNH